MAEIEPKSQSHYHQDISDRHRGPNWKHGLSDKPEFAVWRAMVNRCHNTQNSSYGNYGGRGIAVCERWRNSPFDFLRDMGDRPTPHHSIERIDNNGSYSPENCCWATLDRQSTNRRNTIYATINGVTKNLIAWADEYHLPRNTVYMRYWRGKRSEDLLKPVRQRKREIL